MTLKRMTPEDMIDAAASIHGVTREEMLSMFKVAEVTNTIDDDDWDESWESSDWDSSSC